MAKRQQAGIVYDVLVPGAFYRGTTPGGFTDVTTGLIIPGPRVILSEDGTRVIDRIGDAPGDLPDPIQMPHFRTVNDPDDKKVALKTVAFDFYTDKIPKIHDGIEMALGTNLIEMVSDEDMEEFYPIAWERRKENITFSILKKESRPMKDLMAEALDRKKTAAHAIEVAVEVATKTAKKAARIAKEVEVLEAPPIPPPPPGAPTFA